MIRMDRKGQESSRLGQVRGRMATVLDIVTGHAYTDSFAHPRASTHPIPAYARTGTTFVHTHVYTGSREQRRGRTDGRKVTF